MKLANFKHTLQMFAVYLGATMLDFVSSLHMGPPNEEQNPYSRYPNGAFWPRHALICDSINTIEYVFISLAGYLALRPLGARWARVAAGIPWLYFTYEHLEAACSNLLLRWPGLYVQTAREALMKFLGQ